LVNSLRTNISASPPGKIRLRSKTDGVFHHESTVENPEGLECVNMGECKNGVEMNTKQLYNETIRRSEWRV
ncbi:MAG: hypothetical protein JW760_02010, partial [Spirochaetales bacterium]|nr:hypothetical protein [Spirochaetales bacterium]